MARGHQGRRRPHHCNYLITLTRANFRPRDGMGKKKSPAVLAGLFAWCARHGAQRRVWRCQPRRETESGSDLEVKVLWGPWWREPLAEQQPRRCEAAWEGSCKQDPGPRNTNRIEGGPTVGEEAIRSEARCYPDWRVVDAAGLWGEGHASYPGRSDRLPWS